MQTISGVSAGQGNCTVLLEPRPHSFTGHVQLGGYLTRLQSIAVKPKCLTPFSQGVNTPAVHEPGTVPPLNAARVERLWLAGVARFNLPIPIVRVDSDNSAGMVLVLGEDLPGGTV